MCWRELCCCFRPEIDEGPDLHRTPSVKQRFKQPRLTRDGDFVIRPDIVIQPKVKAANGTANGANGILTSPPGNYGAWNEGKGADFTRESEAAGRAIVNPEKRDALKANERDALKASTKAMESNERDALKASTKAMESNERAKINPPKAIASYEDVLAPKDQTKAAGYDGDDGERVGRRPQKTNIGSEGAPRFGGDG